MLNELRTQTDRDMWESQPRWEVTLSDGTTVIRNDEEINKSSWVVLRNYLLENPSIHITRMIFGFRDNFRVLEDVEGYYFRNSVIGSFAGNKSSFIVGVLKGDKCIVEKWEIPEMEKMWTEERPVDEAGESLIRNVK